MKLKYYAVVPNAKDAIKYWSMLFDVKVIKDPTKNMHGNILLYDQVSILLWPIGTNPPKPGYYILRFEDHEANLWRKSAFRIKNSNLVSVSIDCKEMPWGTTLFEFTDYYNYTWVLEIATSALGENLENKTN